MAERSRFWDGILLGDAVAVGQTHLHDQFFRSVINGTGDRGPLLGWRDDMLVSGNASPLSVAAGGACVYGMLYDSDAAVSVNVPAPPSGLSRYDYVVLRRDWSAQQVRIGRVVGIAGVVPAIPTLTQTAGTIWEVPLALLLVTDAGTITVTDAREFCAFTTEWPANIVAPGMYAEGAVTIAKIPDRARYKLNGAGQIEPDSVNPCTWVAGASYDYWEFADAIQNDGWVYFMGETGDTGVGVDIYLWTVPDVNGAGAGAENAKWDYSIYYGTYDGALTNAAATVNVDQQVRLNTTVYRDQLVAALPAVEGQIIAIQLSRDGVADSYNSDMRLLGIELVWTADA